MIRTACPQDFINQFVIVAHSDFEKVKQLHKLCPALLMTRATWDELAIEAAHMGLVPMAEYLADHGSPVSTCTAVLLGLTAMVNGMVQADPNRLRERSAHDFRLLSFTAFGNERVDIAEVLLDAGINPNAYVFGQTPLPVAAGKGYVELAKLFLERGAELNAVFRSRARSETPLAVARRSKQAKMAEFLR